MNGGLQELARQTGRGPDSHLLHVSTNELNALQGLAESHGGSLTVNPQTGLPEAGFLDNLLPTILGLGLNLIPGVGTLASAALVGGGYGLAKGDLFEGLKAGLGAYGGASLGGTLSSLGAGSSIATNVAQKAATDGATQTLGQQLATQSIPNVTSTIGADGVAKLAMAQGNPMAAASVGNLGAQKLGYEATKSSLGGIQKGLGALQGNWRNLPAAWQATTGGGIRSMAGLAGLASPFLNTDPAKMNIPEEEKSNYEGPYMPSPRQYMSDTRQVTPENSNEWRYFDDINPVPNVVPRKKYAMGGQVDGVSDSVPAMIDGNQPAALSQGEFVVPARVVAEVGNGSSDAGAQKLGMMLAKVEQKMRTARRGQPSGADMVAAQTMGVA